MTSSPNKKQQLSDNRQNEKEQILSELEPADADLILETLSDKTRQQLIKEIEVVIEQRSIYSGPIPSPEMLKQFDEVIPNGADRIMTMAENQSNHRMNLETKVVNANNRDSLLGIIFAGILGIVGLIGGLCLIYTGKSISGFIFSSGSLATLVGLYLKGTSLDKADLQRKTEEEDN